MRTRLALALLASVSAIALAYAPAALASGTQESILQDDGQLIYASPSHMAHTLREIASLGVDRVKVSMVWWLVAPRPDASRQPKFDAADPAAYPPGAWDRYDMLVRMAQELGLKVYFELAPPVPRWALVRHQPLRQGPQLGHAPRRRLFEQFVEAVGRRYSGSFNAPVPATQPTPDELGIADGAHSNSGQSAAIPRVSYWGLWNEPNERQWLNPWWRRLHGHGRAIVESGLYRGLLDAAWTGLAATGHTPVHDTILIGELANSGVLAPIPFTRALYCVGTRSRPLRGLAAAKLGCPKSGNRGAFAAANPALFEASGFALHPYGFGVAPSRPYPTRSWITLHNLTSFRRVLAGALGAYGRRPPGGVQLYLTEWGYITRPPNPFSRTTLADQQVWLDQGDYLAWKYSYVHALAQFLLRDDKPRTQAPKGSRAYWGTFQTGLEYTDGQPKPAFETFGLPIWLPHNGHGNLSVWGQLRIADHSSLQQARLQYQRSAAAAWQTVATIQTTSPEGFLTAHLSLPAAGTVRLAWSNPANGTTSYSRTVRVY